MCGAGVLHFVNPNFFVQIVPDYMPRASQLVAVSGFFELVGGLGLLLPSTRRSASWGLIALYVAVFPANLNMALRPERFAAIPPVLLWLRLPLQAGLIAWAWSVGRSVRSPSI
jgi:uncharacterized membrane protein